MKLILMLVGLITACVAVAAIWSVLLMMLAAILLLFVVIWAGGARIKVTRPLNGQKVVIGYLRWFTFTKV